MAEILLVGNPRKRRRRKMSAKQAKYFGGGRKKRRAPRAKVAKRRRRRAVAVHTNPRRRRVARLSSRRIRRRRSNPSFRGGLGSLKSTVMPMMKDGLIGATGAIGLDLLWGYGKSYLPASIAGNALAQYATKLAGAILVGIVGNKVLKGRGRALSVGAATVVIHDALKAQITASFPTIQLGEYLTYAPTVGSAKRAGRLMSTGMGEYLSGLPNTDGVTMDYSGEYTSDSLSGGF